MLEAVGFGDPTRGWGEIAIGPGCGNVTFAHDVDKSRVVRVWAIA